MSDPKNFPVMVEFDWTRVEARATYDRDTGQLAMRIRPDSRLADLLAGADDEAEVRGLSFGYVLKQYLACCQARYENDGPPPQRTHTCDLEPGHEGLHHCPECNKHWTVQVDR